MVYVSLSMGYITNETIDKILTEHRKTNLSILKICQRDGHIYSSILDRIHKRKIMIGQGADYIEDFFSRIDTEEKAYILGLLWADGCIYQRKGFACCRLSLTGADGYMVEMVRDAIAKDVKVKYLQPKTLYRTKPIALVVFVNRQLVNDLIKHGCVPKKSAVIELPVRSVPTHLMNHFIRGHFDGDGCMSYTVQGKNSPKPWLGICGSLKFCEQLKEWLSIHLGISSVVCRDKRKTGDAGLSLKIGGSKQIIRFMEWMYGGMTTNFYLKRKRDKYQSFVVLREERNIPLATALNGRFLPR